MKKCLSFIATAFIGLAVQAQITSYDLSTVPDSLKKGADVIKRFEDIFFEVTDIDRAYIKIHQVYTVVNEDGKSILNFNEHTSKFVTLGDVDIKVYDASGKQLLKYKKKDVSSIALGDGLIDDGKTWYLTVPVATYPVTV